MHPISMAAERAAAALRLDPSMARINEGRRAGLKPPTVLERRRERESDRMSHETPIILASGLRRTGVVSETKDVLASSMHSSQLSFSIKQRKKKEEEGVCSLVVTGMEWTGQVLAQEVVPDAKLDAVMPGSLLTKWENCCSWYQMVGSSSELTGLREKLAKQEEKHAELLGKAPTATVRGNIAKTETYIKRLEEGISACKIGYIRRRPEIIVDRQPMDVAATLRGNGCHSTEHEVEFHPARVGMGPRVMLRVTCLNQRKRVMDEFQAVVPCKHEGHEEPEGGIRAQGHLGEYYSSMTMADLAAGLQNIFFERNKGWQQNALPILRYYGKAVDGSKQGEDVFKYYRGEGLYQDKISIELDVKPFVEELTPEQEAAKHAISTVVSEVMISMANM